MSCATYRSTCPVSSSPLRRFRFGWLSESISEKGENMKGKTLLSLVALFLVVALAVPAMAKPVSKSLNLPTQTRLGGTLLDAGTYKLLIDDTSVTVKKGRDVIAQVQGTWEAREKKNDLTTILQGPNGEVQEIRFAGERRALVIRGR